MCNGFHLWGSCQSRDTCVDHELAESLFTWFLKRDYEKRIFEKKTPNCILIPAYDNWLPPDYLSMSDKPPEDITKPY